LVIAAPILTFITFALIVVFVYLKISMTKSLPRQSEPEAAVHEVHVESQRAEQPQESSNHLYTAPSDGTDVSVLNEERIEQQSASPQTIEEAAIPAMPATVAIIDEQTFHQDPLLVLAVDNVQSSTESIPTGPLSNASQSIENSIIGRTTLISSEV
jgi:hypothetical protein